MKKSGDVFSSSWTCIHIDKAHTISSVISKKGTCIFLHLAIIKHSFNRTKMWYTALFLMFETIHTHIHVHLYSTHPKLFLKNAKLIKEKQ